MPKVKDIYNKDYFYSEKSWGDGYPNYDNYSSIESHPWGFMVEKIVQKKQHGKMLDVGCALGHFVSFFPENFERFGSDISDYAIETASARFPEIKFNAANISEELPFKEKFDLITAFDVLEHTLDLNSALKNISSMLKKDGLLVVAVPIASKMHHLLSALGVGFLTAMDSHLTLTTAKAWREIVLHEHFEIVEEFSTTWKGKHIPKMDLFQVFFLRKKG